MMMMAMMDERDCDSGGMIDGRWESEYLRASIDEFTGCINGWPIPRAGGRFWVVEEKVLARGGSSSRETLRAARFRAGLLASLLTRSGFSPRARFCVPEEGKHGRVEALLRLEAGREGETRLRESGLLRLYSRGDL